MEYKDHFQKEDIVDFELPDGSKWAYKPTTGGDETDWLRFIYKRGEDGKVYEDLGELNKCKLKFNIKKVPYSPEHMAEILKSNIPKDWAQLSADERWAVLFPLRGPIMDQLIKELNVIDGPSGDKKKD